MIHSFQPADLKLLRVFVTVADSGGLSAAEIPLGSRVSQISTQISNLEDRLGVQLCHRGRSGFALTAEGQAIYEETRRLFEAIEDFRLKANETREQLAGEVRLGLCDNLASNPEIRVAEAIARFKSRENSVRFDLRIASPLELESGVLDGSLHLAIGLFHHQMRGLTYRAIANEVHYLYCGRRHPLFECDDHDLTVEQLLHYDYANRKEAEVEGDLASDFGTRGSAASDHMEALTFLILSGAYLAYLPEDCARPWIEAKEIRPLLPETLQQRATLHLVTRDNVVQPRAVATFIEDLLEAHAVGHV